MATGTSTSSASTSNIEPNEHSTTPSLLCDLPTCLGVPYHEFGACAPTRADYTELFDEMFDSLVASDDVFDQGQRTERKPTVSTNSTTKPQQRFAPVVSDSDLVKARQLAIPKCTREDTSYCIRVWEEWAKSRPEHGVQMQPLLSMDTASLQYWLTHFILEVRKQNGLEYPPNTLHHLVCGIMRFLRQNGRPEVDFFKDA